MTHLVLKWVLNCLALFLVMKLVPGIQIDQFSALLIGTLVLGLLNTFLRPLVFLLTLPVNLMTMGLFTFVINGLLFQLAAHMVSGFRVSGFFTALLAAFLYSVFSFLLNLIFRTEPS